MANVTTVYKLKLREIAWMQEVREEIGLARTDLRRTENVSERVVSVRYASLKDVFKIHYRFFLRVLRLLDVKASILEKQHSTEVYIQQKDVTLK